VAAVIEACAPLEPDCREELRVDISPEDRPDWLDLDGYRYKGRKKTIEECIHPKTKITKVRSEWEVYVELAQLSSRCIFCGQEGCLRKLRTNLQGIRDQSIRGTPCMVRVDRPYYQCTKCKQPWSELLPHLDPKRDMTDRLRNQVWNDSFRKSHALIEIETGLDEKTIREIQKDGFETLDNSRKIELPEHIYFDEINLSPKRRYKGIDLTIPIKRRMRAVCGDGGRGTPIEVFERCEVALVAQFFSQFTPERLARVKCISMDLSEFFDAVTRACLPGVPRIADHYHVKKLINAHFDDDFRLQFGKELVTGALAAAAAEGITDETELKKIQVAAEKDASWLRDHRFSMLKSPGKRLDQENLVIEMLGSAHDLMKHAIAEKDALFALWKKDEDSSPNVRKFKHTSASEARHAYVVWMDNLTEKTRPYWQGLINSFETWSTEIFSFFDRSITNSPAETGNSIMRSQNRRGQDYGFPMIRGKALYRDVRGEDVPWEGEDKSDPTAASKARTFKAARARKEQTEKRRLQRSGGFLGEPAPLLSPPAAPVLLLTAGEPVVNSSQGCTSSDSRPVDPSSKIGVVQAHLGEQPVETPVLEDPKPAQLISTGSGPSKDSDGLGNGENSCQCPNDLDCMFLRSGSPCSWCHYVRSQPEAVA
jgi:transposase